MKFIVLVSFIIINSLAFNQTRMTPELLWKIKRIGNIQVSPDKTEILYSEKTYKLEENSGKTLFYIMKIEDKSIKKLTVPHDQKIWNVQWVPNSKRIAFLMRSKNGVNIFSINVDGTGIKQVSNVERGMNEFKFSPSGNRILFSKDIKMDLVHSTDLAQDLSQSNAKVYNSLMYRHWSTYSDGSYTHIFFSVVDQGKLLGSGIDIMKDERFDAPLKPFGGLEQANFSQDGNLLAYTSKKLNGTAYSVSTNSDIYVYDVSKRETSNISKGMMGYDTEPAYSNDGKKMAWLSMETNGFEADKNDIIVYDLNSKEKINITQNIDLTISSFIWDEETKMIYFLAPIEATYQLFQIDIKSRKHQILTAGDHNFTSLDIANGQLISGKQSMNHPTDIYSVDINSKKELQLTDANKEIYDKLHTGEIEKRWVNTSDGKKQLVWVIYPPNFDRSKKYPALLYCQGGPQSAVSQFFSYRWNFQLMAANDYIIVAPNRRGLPGFGQDWNDAISKDWGGQAIQDYLSAIDELKKEPFIDENKIGAVGASYGGYSVYYLAGMHEERFACFISHCGLFNLESWYGTTEELFFANHDIGGSYYQEGIPEGYFKNSPHRYVHKWDTPMLIFQGEKDYRVPVGQGLEAFQALQLRYIDSKLILFPEENHWVLSPQNGVFWHRQYYAWLAKHLK